jgi:hypothetical protein
MDELGFLVYLAVKLGAYIGWCYQGARLHGHRDRLLLKGIVYGVVRAVMGAILGLWAILMLVNWLYQFTDKEVLLYVAVYVPVRWVEWSLMAVIMDQEHRTAANFAIGRGATTRLWRLGGIVISCLADIPMMISMNHLPIGRFMC